MDTDQINIFTSYFNNMEIQNALVQYKITFAYKYIQMFLLIKMYNKPFFGLIKLNSVKCFK